MRNYTANIISSSSSPTNAEIEQATTGRARQRERVNIERERAGTGTVTKSTKVRRVSFQDNVVVGNDDTRVFKVVVDEECPSSVMDNDGPVHRLFQKARQLVNPKALYRSMYLYAERKLVILFFIHIVCTLAIWCKFSFDYKRNFLLRLDLVASPCFSLDLSPSLFLQLFQNIQCNMNNLMYRSFLIDKVQYATGDDSIRRRQILVEDSCTVF